MRKESRAVRAGWGNFGRLDGEREGSAAAELNVLFFLLVRGTTGGAAARFRVSARFVAGVFEEDSEAIPPEEINIESYAE